MQRIKADDPLAKIHVLHVVPGLMPGGMELAMARIISGLNNETFKHSIACLKGEPEIADKLPSDANIYTFHACPNEPQLPFRLARLIREIKPNIIHARNWGAWPDIAVGRLFSWPLVPLIYSFHGLGNAGYMPWRRRAASRVLVHLTSHLFALSRQSKDFLVEQWGWPANRTEIIPNGVDTNRFFPRPKAKGSRFIVGAVGNLRTVKNHRLIIEACRPLIEEGHDVEIRIAGEGELRADLVEFAVSLGMGDKLILPGRLDDIPGFLNELDMFVLSSDSEQHPNVLNEAMACGVPSVATNVGCVEDLLDRGRCGEIIAPGDAAALSDAIKRYLVNPQLRHSYGKLGLEHVRGNYSFDLMLNRYRDMYGRLSMKKVLADR